MVDISILSSSRLIIFEECIFLLIILGKPYSSNWNTNFGRNAFDAR